MVLSILSKAWSIVTSMALTPSLSSSIPPFMVSDFRLWLQLLLAALSLPCW